MVWKKRFGIFMPVVEITHGGVDYSAYFQSQHVEIENAITNMVLPVSVVRGIQIEDDFAFI